MTNVEVTVTPAQITIEMIGHADYAEKGNDIVCSAISTLEYIVAGWCEMNPEKAIVKKYEIEPGYSFMKLIPIGNDVYNIVEAAVIGFMGIAERYPENIKLKKVWKSGRNPDIK